jgi:uncharacterized protein (DUF362 family)/NAD-dependent dihydropyrimidine dehydrogenase PreA subunit
MPKKTSVVLQQLDTYERRATKAAIEELLSPLGGISAFVQPGQRVLLKPNMLSGKGVDAAVTTHPEIVRAVIELAQAAGGIVSVGDSPGVGTPYQVAQRCGILAVIEETGATFAPFAESIRITPRGGTFHHFDIARDIVETDVIINLPKLKTHQMMGMTGAVKNLFGAVLGLSKAHVHLQAGADKGFFALMLLELVEEIRPALTIVDGVLAMEGDGPGSGDPIQLGVILAGVEPMAVDVVAAELIGLVPESIWTWTVAKRSGRPWTDLADIELCGTPLAALQPRAFKPAKNTEVHFGVPKLLQRPLRRALSARPVVDRKKCQGCGICVKSCPPHAMSIHNDRLLIDEERCILCFCCHELCPYGALHSQQGLILRLSQKLAQWRRNSP